MSEAQISSDSLHEKYTAILRTVAATAQDFETLLREVNDEQLIAKNGYSQKVFQTLRERADSELLSLAFFGAFSSGKSFLISGLNNKIDLFEHQGREQYAPLLPASPRHTSSCPVAVEPLPASKHEDAFWVAFEGADEWEQKSPVTQAIIQPYVTDLPNAKVQRLTNMDRMRIVLKAKLGIASAPMKARLYDLPGFGAIGFNYESVIREYVQQADCIVYIAWAIRPLDEKDLELLRDIYLHHKTTGKPVFFVLTQIDLSWDIDAASGKVKWEDVLEANNEFLAAHFIADGKPDQAFIGSGFIPVSPALEAKGLSLLLQKPATAKEMINDSRMEFLRDRFNEYLQNTSGPMHLAELSAEVQRLLARLLQDLRFREMAESTPLEEAQKTIKGFKAQRSVLIKGKHILGEELTNLGQAAIKRAFAGSDPDDLARLLVERLEPRIKTANVLNDNVLHGIETEKAAIVREWVSRNSRALIPRWVGAWDSFVKQSTVQAEGLLDKALTARREAIKEEEPETDIIIEVPNPSGPEAPGGETIQEIIDVIATAWKAWTLMAGIGATGILSSAAAPATVPILAALGPIGWGILATAGVGAVYGQWRLAQHRNQRKEALLKDLPEYAQRVVNAYQTQANEFIQSRIGMLLEIMDNEVERLTSSINSLEQRLLTGEYVDRTKRLETLRRLTHQCIAVDGQINEFYKTAASIQPGIITMVK